MSTPPTLSEATAPTDGAQWFASQVQAHEPGLRAYLGRAFPGVRDADDVVQESYLRIWRVRLDRVIASPRHFLFRIARNLAIDSLRRAHASPVQPCADVANLPIASDLPDIAENVCTKEELALLAQAIKSLPANLRSVVTLRQLDGLTQPEIARRLGLSELTVQTYVVRGLDKIEAYLSRRRGR